MKKNINIFLLLLLSSFLIFNQTNATYIVKQDGGTYLNTTICEPTGSSNGTSFVIGNTGYAGIFHISSSSVDIGYNVRAYLYHTTSTSANGTAYIVATSTLGTNVLNGMDFDFSNSNYFLDTTTSTYVLSIGIENGDGSGKFYYEGHGTNFSVGSGAGNLNAGSQTAGCPTSVTTNFPTGSTSFWKGYFLTKVFNPTITINYPINASNLGGDFSHWQAEVHTSNALSFTPAIVYGSSTINLNYIDYGFGQSQAANTTTTQIIAKTQSLLNGTFYAYGELLDINNNVIASSSIISFDTTGNQTIFTGATNYQAPSSTQTFASSTINIDCSGSGIITDSICSVFKYLFVPTQNDLQQFTQLKDQITNKPPFGWYNSISGALVFSTSTAVITNFYVFTGGGIYTAIIHPLDIGLGIVIFTLLAWWIFHKFRNFNL